MEFRINPAWPDFIFLLSQFHESDDCEVLHGCEYDGHHAYVDKAQNDRSVACNGVPGIVAWWKD